MSGGCINGGGQPIRPSFQNKPKDCADRDQCLRGYDARSAIRFSHENKAVQTLYDEYLEAPLSDRAHHLLHVEDINISKRSHNKTPESCRSLGFCVIHRLPI